MLTTHELVQNATTFFFPILLILISWYCLAAGIRALFALYVKIRDRVQSKKLRRNFIDLFEVIKKKKNYEGMDRDFLLAMEKVYLILEGNYKEFESSKKFRRRDIFWNILEVILFSALFTFSFFNSGGLFYKIPLYIHGVGVLFFLSFLINLRRIFILVPLTVLALLSWEIFSFITNFEKTLSSTTLLARIEVMDVYRGEEGLEKASLKLLFPNENSVRLDIEAKNKIYLEGKYYRVSPEVLLFGGRNIATLDRIFSDVLPSDRGISLIKEGEIPPQYRLPEKGERNFYIPELIPKQKLFLFIWREFFALKKRQPKDRYIKMVNLASVPCAPVVKGQVFEVRLRNVGGLECYIVYDSNSEEKGDKKVPTSTISR